MNCGSCLVKSLKPYTKQLFFKMEIKNKGYEIEKRMMNFFKGTPSDVEEIDFETSKCVYEVKSCKLFHKTINQDNKKNSKYKNIESTQLGRFYIRTDNHIGLFLHAIEKGKIPKYIFVIKSGKQIIFKTVRWEHLIVPNLKAYHYILLKDIFSYA